MFNYNPYYQPNRYQAVEQSYPHYPQSYQQPAQPYPQQNVLQGKSVDNLEVVKAMDIPLDGSISYFPIADGTAIVTKQLQRDGTSRVIVYKPDMSLTNENGSKTNFNSEEINYIKEELKTIKTQIQALGNNLKGVDSNESNADVTEVEV